MVVIDEAYFEFSGVTVIPWIRRHANLIVTRTFSKTAGLAGLRLGCIFVNRELAASMRKSQSPYPVNCRRTCRCRSGHARPRFHRSHRSRSESRTRAARTRTRPPRPPLFPKRRQFHPGLFRRPRKKDRRRARPQRHLAPRPLRATSPAKVTCASPSALRRKSRVSSAPSRPSYEHSFFY